jgi:hypothetical protein
VIERQVVVRLFLEFIEFFLVRAYDPSRRRNVDGFELGLGINFSCTFNIRRTSRRIAGSNSSCE